MKNFMQRVNFSIKTQEIRISLYENSSHILVNGIEQPSLIISIGRTRIAVVFNDGKVEL